ncbi:MAG: L-histidine N(alpha)-methyltransferase [Balneolaceae bacterium]|nr:MAG: L-histidine N(alpha)-methyltransferase [Balneolaceae bacterium]
MLREVLEGLRKEQKSLPSKYFYDERGSELFEMICEQEEYYPTNTEIDIMQTDISEISERIGSGVELIEFGSGSSIKTRLLLDHLDHPVKYIPVDISEEFLMKASEKISLEYPDLTVNPVAADYTRRFTLPKRNGHSTKRVIYFPGSTIGNFLPERASAFLKTHASLLKPGGGMLIGVDRKKSKERLEAAYNDSAGVTAQFNKNLLLRINRELAGTFDLTCFKHKAFYNEAEGRIEMHLVSTKNQDVTVAGEVFHFEAGETIHTENSYKYTPVEVKELFSEQYRFEEMWTDPEDLFGVYYFSVSDGERE